MITPSFPGKSWLDETYEPWSNPYFPYCFVWWSIAMSASCPRIHGAGGAVRGFGVAATFLAVESNCRDGNQPSCRDGHDCSTDHRASCESRDRAIPRTDLSVSGCNAR